MVAFLSYKGLKIAKNPLFHFSLIYLINIFMINRNVAPNLIFFIFYTIKNVQIFRKMSLNLLPMNITLWFYHLKIVILRLYFSQLSNIVMFCTFPYQMGPTEAMNGQNIDFLIFSEPKDIIYV